MIDYENIMIAEVEVLLVLSVVIVIAFHVGIIETLFQTLIT